MNKRITAIILSILITAMMIIPAVSVSAAEEETDASAAVILGNADGDESVTVLDATRIQRYLAELAGEDEIDLAAADADEDGDVTILDATVIQRWLADFEVDHPIGEVIGGSDEPTEVPDTPTEAPEAPTEAPETPTETPETPTEAPETPTEAPETPTEASETPTEAPVITGDEWKENTGTIVLSDDGITVTGSGIYVDGNTVIITEGGDWEVTGTCSDGMIYVCTCADDEEKDINDKVKLRLNGMSLTNPDGPAIYFDRCKKAFITIESGSVNTVTDGNKYTKTVEEHVIAGATYSIDASAAKGAIHTDDSLEIKGKGTLNVNGNYKHGIASDDDIVIENGVINITSVKDGIHVNDDLTLDGKSIEITINASGDGFDSEGTLNLSLVKKVTVNAAGKAIKADGAITITDGTYICDTDDDCINGNAAVAISGGTFTLTSGDDAIAAVTDLTITGGSVTVMQAGGKGIKNDGDISISGGAVTINSTDDCINGNAAVNLTGGTYDLTSGDDAITAASTLTIENVTVTVSSVGKGIKAESDLIINSGVFTVNSTDDSVHCNGNVTINGGSFTITSGDDGIHADTTLTVTDGTIIITKSYEGLEANDVVITGGVISIVASDDGINAAGGQDQSSQGGRPGQNPFQPGSSSNSSITISGGEVYVVSSGDGIDSNGALTFSGGIVVVQGPNSGGNFAVDADSTVNFSGGTVVALCSSGAMWEDITRKTGSAVYNKSIGSVTKGSVICVTDSSGSVLAAVESRLTGSLGVLFYTAGSTSLSNVKFVTGGTYSSTLNSYGYGTGGTVSGGSSYSPSASSGGGSQPGGRW